MRSSPNIGKSHEKKVSLDLTQWHYRLHCELFPNTRLVAMDTLLDLKDILIHNIGGRFNIISLRIGVR